MIYRYIYKITCLKGTWEGKFSFGQHTTENLDDNYFSSSKLINDYKKKYGLENCKREIISFHNTEEELNQAEYDIIHPWLGNEMCLNLCEGGYYGKPSDETRKKVSESNKGRKPWNKGLTGWMSEEGRKSISESRKKNGPTKGFTGMNHTEESKMKTSKSTSGVNNGMYGKNHSDETRRKQSEARKLWWANKNKK